MINLLRSRHSIRKFQDTPVESSTIELLKEALLRSPTSRGKSPWEFVFIQDHAILSKFAHAKMHGGEFLEHTPLGIVICGNESISDVWVEDCSIASIIVQLVAHSKGLGSCWVQIRKRNNKSGAPAETIIQNVLHLPSNLRVLAIIGIGYPDESKKSTPTENLNFKKIHNNLYTTSPT